jgi:hypothetical protein
MSSSQLRYMHYEWNKIWSLGRVYAIFLCVWKVHIGRGIICMHFEHYSGKKVVHYTQASHSTTRDPKNKYTTTFPKHVPSSRCDYATDVSISKHQATTSFIVSGFQSATNHSHGLIVLRTSYLTLRTSDFKSSLPPSSHPFSSPSPPPPA